MSKFTPALHVSHARGGVRLKATGLTQASGPTLEDAADEFVRKVLLMAIAFRSGEVAPSGPELKLDPAVHAFICELADIGARGGDIRHRLFGRPPDHP